MTFCIIYFFKTLVFCCPNTLQLLKGNWLRPMDLYLCISFEIWPMIKVPLLYINKDFISCNLPVWLSMSDMFVWCTRQGRGGGVESVVFQRCCLLRALGLDLYWFEFDNDSIFSIKFVYIQGLGYTQLREKKPKMKNKLVCEGGLSCM